jgi:hypothetical protein
MEMQRPKAITVNTISSIMSKVLDRSGLRARGQYHGRTEIMQNHGLRQFWDNTVTRAGMDWYISEKLIGHSVGLKDHYTKLSDDDKLEGSDKMRGYVYAITDLTINEEFKYREC